MKKLTALLRIVVLKKYQTQTLQQSLFARNFAAVSQDKNFPGPFRLKKQETATLLDEKLRDTKATFDHGEALNASFSLHELKRAIRESKEKSAPGEDNIPYAALKYLPKSRFVFCLICTMRYGKPAYHLKHGVTQSYSLC